MLRVLFLATVTVVAMAAAATQAQAGDYAASTRTAAILRAAPSVTSEQLGVVPAGTSLVVVTCFDEGAYCKVDGDGITGFVAGQLLFVDGTGQSVMAAEQARWEAIRSAPSYWDAALGRFRAPAKEAAAP